MSVNRKDKSQILTFLIVPPRKYPKARVWESAFATCSLSTESYKTIEKKYAKNASHHFTIKREIWTLFLKASLRAIIYLMNELISLMSVCKLNSL